MQLESPIATIDWLLYRLRLVLVAVALLFILYSVVYLWFFIPYEDFSYVWRPDSRLVVYDVPAESLAAPYLQPGDVVAEVGGQPTRRMRPIYPLPLQTSYEYMILRQGVAHTYTIPFSGQVTPLALQIRLPVTILTMAGWLVGAIMLLWARTDNWQALRAGAVFLFAAAVAIGVYGALTGVPAAWVSGNVLLFPFAVAWVYLGLIPRASPIEPRAQRLFKALITLAGALAIIATYEVLVLYPRPTSINEQIGVSIYALGLLLGGLGLLANVIILTVRGLRMARSAYLRQQIMILLVFFGLGTLPMVLFTILPRVAFDAPLLPFPATISLLLLVPAGYLFIIYRRGFLGLDLFFSRSLYLILLSLLVFGFYASALYLVQRLLNQNNAELIVPATLVFPPTLLLAVFVNRPVRDFVDRLVYGDVGFGQDALAEFTLALSSRPELSTLDDIVAALAKALSSTKASLALRDETGRLMPVTTIGTDDLPSELPDELHALDQLALRSAEGDTNIERQALRVFAWAEILVPVKVRDEQIGLLALSRPGPDGYFNTKQVTFLTQAAGVLAVGIENIYLFDSTRKQSRQRLIVQEEERKNLSRQLHDDPLQRVTYAISIIDQLLARHSQANDGMKAIDNIILAGREAAPKLQTAADNLRQAAMSLRQVCIGLYPPFHDQGIELAIQDVIDYFKNQYGLDIRYMSTLDGMNLPVSEQVTAAVSRVLTESLNNIFKHAQGAEVCVTLRISDDGQLVLSVTDSGPGSQVASLSFSELMRRQHLGIVGMHEWAQQIGGELRIQPNEPSGTRVVLRCPV
jgi:signal transduction histidine kinase